MTYTFLLTKKVGSPCESFEVVSGRPAKNVRTRFKCFEPGSVFCSLAFDFIYLTLRINELFERLAHVHYKLAQDFLFRTYTSSGELLSLNPEAVTVPVNFCA